MHNFLFSVLFLLNTCLPRPVLYVFGKHIQDIDEQILLSGKIALLCKEFGSYWILHDCCFLSGKNGIFEASWFKKKVAVVYFFYWQVCL